MSPQAKKWLRALLRDCVPKPIPARVDAELRGLGVMVQVESERDGRIWHSWSYFLDEKSRKRATELLKEGAMSDPIHPSASLLCKLGSIIVHMEEMLSPGGHGFDRLAAANLLKDPEVLEWLNDMRTAALLPVRRDALPEKPKRARRRSRS